VSERVCPTCDGYQLVPHPMTGFLTDCPDCHAGPYVRCPVHFVAVDADGRCRKCLALAVTGAELLRLRHVERMQS